MQAVKHTTPLSQTEGFGHIENFYRSGLRPSEYYKAHGLSEYQFFSWRKRYLQSHPQAETQVSSGKLFHRIKIADRPVVASFSGLEIHYPHGVKLVIGSGHAIEIEKLRLLIQIRV